MSDDEIDVPAVKKQRIFYGSLEETIRELEIEHLKKSENQQQQQQNINVSDGKYSPNFQKILTDCINYIIFINNSSSPEG